MTRSLARIARDGYIAARSGAAASANPWRPETVGGHAWSIGWNIGGLPPVVRWAFALVLL